MTDQVGIAVKSFIMLFPDGTNRTGKFMKADVNVVMTEKAERRAAARILGCKEVMCLEITVQGAVGIEVANVYFDPEGEAKGLALNPQIETMVQSMHDQARAPLPELPVRLFGPVMLVPASDPEPATVGFIA